MVMKQNCLLYLFLAILMSTTFFVFTSQTVCTQGDFPKVFGGSNGQTYFNQMEYHDDSEFLCACGDVHDNNLAPGASTYYDPYVVCYQGAPNFPYKWGKFIQQTTASVTFRSLAFNPAGTRIIAHSSNSVLTAIVAVWNTNDGTLINARTYLQSDNYNRMLRNTIIDPSGFCIISKSVVTTVNGAAASTRIFKFQSETFSTAIVWGRQTITSTVTPMGLVFGYSYDEIIAFTSTSTTSYLTSLNSADGTIRWHYSFSATNGGSYSLSYRSFSPTSQMIVGVMSQSGQYLKYARIVLANGVITERDLFYDSTYAGHSIAALRLIDVNTAKAVITGTISTFTKQTFLTSINFSTLQIQYLQTIPTQSSTNTLNLGRFVTDTKFFLGAYDTKVYMNTATTPTQQTFSQLAGLIFSSDMADTCQTFYSNPAYTSTLTKSANAITDTTQTTAGVYNDIQATYTATQYIPTAVSDLVLTTLTSSTFCSRVNSGTYNLYVITSTQTTTSFSASAGAAATFSITAFSTSSQSCGASSPTFTYTAVNNDFYETPLASFMSVNPSTGAISLTSSSVAGVYSIKITGTLQNGQRKRETFQITVTAGNQPPTFSSALTTQTGPMNTVNTYQLPTITDPESDTVTVTTYKTGDTVLPGFITFSATTTYVYTINPTTFADVGTVSITVKLNDGTNTPTFTFDVVVTNTAPTFSSAPQSQTVALNSVKAVPLPTITDAEGNSITVTYTPTLAFVSITSTTLTISPTLFSEVMTNSITITLSDGQPLSTDYPINIVVTNSAPTFSTAPADQTVAYKASLDYTLSSYSDAEGNAVTISLSPSLSFVTLVGSTVQINPTFYSQVGTHAMTVTLSDGEPKTSSYTFNIIITNSPPSFSSSLVDQTVPIFSTKSYTLPSYSDPEGSTVTLSLTPTLSYITLVGSTINIIPTLYSEVGTQTMTVSLSDGLSQSNVQFNIQITNAAPTFSTAPVDQNVALNSVITYTLPSYSDPEGDNSISLSITGQPSFVSLSGDTLTISPTLYSEVGSHTVTITLQDGEPKTSTCILTIQVTNQAPTFVSAPVDQTVHVNVPKTYTLPSFIDPEGDSAFISISPSLSYITLSGSTITMNPTLFSQLGPVSITIELRDNEPKSTFYTIIVTIINSAPSFTSTTPIDQIVPLNKMTTYTLPFYSDPEGHFITSTLTPALSFVTLVTNILTISPTSFSEVNDYSMTLTLSDSEPKSNTYFFQISVTNSPPVFDSPLVDQTVTLNSIKVYTLPSVTDAESNPFTMAVTPMPSFLTVINAGAALQFSPFLSSDVGTQTITLTLQDGQPLVSTYTFNVIVIEKQPDNNLLDSIVGNVNNIGPPVFIQNLQELTIQAGHFSQIKLPTIFEPDNEAIKVTIQLSDCLPFATYYQQNTSITFYPSVKNVRENPYQIQIKLEDLNPYPKFSTYTLSVTVKGNSQLNDTQNTTNNQNGSLNSNNSQSAATNGENYQNYIAANQSINENKRGYQKYVAKLKTVQMTKDGQLTLKVLCSKLANILVDYINATDLELTIIESNQRIKSEIISKDLDQKTFKLKLFFSDPSKVSEYQDLDILEVKVIKTVKFANEMMSATLQQGTILKVALPPQLPPENIVLMNQIQSGIYISSLVFMSSSVFINLFLQVFETLIPFSSAFCMSYIWEMLDGLSFLMILSLISINFPGFVQDVQISFLNFIYMDVLQTDMWIPQSLYPDDEEDHALNPYFEINSFASTSAVKNLGSTFVFICIYLIELIFLAILKLIGTITPKLQRLEEWLSGKLFWNDTIRFYLQQFTPLVFASYINIYDIKYQSVGDWISSVLTFVNIILTHIGLIILPRLLSKSVQDGSIHSKQFHLKYGNVIEGQNLKTKIGVYWNVLLLIRWSLTIFILVVLRDFQIIQIATLLGLTILFQCLLVYGNPLLDQLELKIFVFNEVTVTVYLYLLIGVTDILPKTFVIKTYVGWAMLSIVFLSAAVNIIKTLIKIALGIRLKIRRIRNSQISKNLKKFVSELSKPDITRVNNYSNSNIMSGTQQQFFQKTDNQNEQTSSPIQYNPQDWQHQSPQEPIQHNDSFSKRSLNASQLTASQQQTPLKQQNLLTENFEDIKTRSGSFNAGSMQQNQSVTLNNIMGMSTMFPLNKEQSSSNAPQIEKEPTKQVKILMTLKRKTQIKRFQNYQNSQLLQ